MKKRGQAGGMVGGLIFAMVGLVITLIIGFLIIATLVNANFFTTSRTTQTVTNESAAWINSTGYRLAQFNAGTSLSPSITVIYNTTNQTGGASQGYNATTPIAAGNYSLNTDTGVVTNLSTPFTNVSISYTYTLRGNQEIATQNMNGNLTSGVNNVSAQIPVVFTVAVIVLLLSVLTVLVIVYRRMRMGGSGSI